MIHGTNNNHIPRRTINFGRAETTFRKSAPSFFIVCIGSSDEVSDSDARQFLQILSKPSLGVIHDGQTAIVFSSILISTSFFNSLSSWHRPETVNYASKLSKGRVFIFELEKNFQNFKHLPSKISDVTFVLRTTIKNNEQTAAIFSAKSAFAAGRKSLS